MDSANNINDIKFFYIDVWLTLLRHRFADTQALCEAQAKINQGVTGEIGILIACLSKPSSIAGFLDNNEIDEAKIKGFRALFFGIANLVIGRGSLAFKLFETASETEISRIPALVYLASIYLMQNNREMARETIREGLSLARDIGEFHAFKARLLLHDNDYCGAEAELAIAREKGNYSPLNFVRFELELLMAQDKQDDAIAAATTLLKDGLEGFSSHEIAATGLGVLISCGALDEANNYLDQALENDKDNVTLLAFRAEIAILNGRFRVAAVAINRALKQNEDNIDLLHKKASLAGRGFSPEQGLEALDKVIKLSCDMPPPNRAVYMAIYGDIYCEQGKNEKAVAAYEAALEVDGKCIPALAGLSQILTTLGHLDEAKAAQDKIYTMAPVRAMQMMINADRIPKGDEEINRMEEMSVSTGTPLPMRASLNLSLANVYQKRNEHTKAMDFADKANEITRKFISFDPEREAKHVDRIIARMSKEFFETRKEYGSDSNLPIFILGMPRSGTTLVEQIVGGHSTVFPGGELGLMPTMWRRLVAWEHRLGSAFRHIPDCVVELTQEQSVKFADRVEGEYRELMPDGSSGQYITDKLPHNFKNIGLIKLLYPKAKIIYCRRSAGGIALSNYFTDYKARHGGMGFAYHKEWIGSEIANCQRIMDHWIDLFKDDIHVVDYEALVENSESIVKDMFQYIGLSWEEQVMDFSNLKRAVKTASVIQVRKPMYTSSKEKWRHYEEQLKPVFLSLASRKEKEAPEPLALPPHQPGLFFDGMELLEKGQNVEAENIFQTILDEYPRHAAAMHMLGAAYSNQGKIQAAHKCMKRSIQLNSGNHTWYGNFAAILDHMRQPEEAKNIREKGEILLKRGGYIPEQKDEML